MLSRKFRNNLVFFGLPVVFSFNYHKIVKTVENFALKHRVFFLFLNH
jgi:hypothetical protein